MCSYITLIIGLSSRDWEVVDHTTKEIKMTVDFHMRHMEEIESELPAMIDIGAFRINVEIVKQGLIKRKRSLYMSILDSFSTRLRNIILQVQCHANTLITMLNISPNKNVPHCFRSEMTIKTLSENSRIDPTTLRRSWK